MPHLGQVVLACISLVLLFSSLTTATPVHHDAALEPVSPLIANRHPKSPYGAVFCGKFCTANRGDAKMILGIMTDLAPYDPPESDNCTTPARTCRRHGCFQTSGVYVCNDNYFPLNLSLKFDIGLVAQPLMDKCCHGGLHKGISGQQFVDELGYNIIVAYANCKHGVDNDRPGIGPPSDPWGPNGVCVM